MSTAPFEEPWDGARGMRRIEPRALLALGAMVVVFACFYAIGRAAGRPNIAVGAATSAAAVVRSDATIPLALSVAPPLLTGAERHAPAAVPASASRPPAGVAPQRAALPVAATPTVAPSLTPTPSASPPPAPTATPAPRPTATQPTPPAAPVAGGTPSRSPARSPVGSGNGNSGSGNTPGSSTAGGGSFDTSG